jgi:hypothetical protein
MREPERLKRVTFVRLQQRNASGIASRSTVAADKSITLKTSARREDERNGLVSSVIVPPIFGVWKRRCDNMGTLGDGAARDELDQPGIWD